MVRFYHYFFTSNPAISQTYHLNNFGEKKVNPQIPHERGARKLQIGPIALKLALRVVHPSSYVALQLFIEFWPSQPTLSIFLYLEQESSSLVLLASVYLF